jgi:outer membrane biosynthesis protein TonB
MGQSTSYVINVPPPPPKPAPPPPKEEQPPKEKQPKPQGTKSKPPPEEVDSSEQEEDQPKPQGTKSQSRARQIANWTPYHSRWLQPQSGVQHKDLRVPTMFAIYGHIDQDEEKKKAEIVKRWRDIVCLGRRTMVQQMRDAARVVAWGEVEAWKRFQ